MRFLALFSSFSEEKTGKQSYLRERGTCDCRACLDSLVFIWSAAICADRKHSKLCGCIFETVSGFTTTGSTILTDIEALPKGVAFWRSLTHWIGGMGVLVFVMMLTSLDDEHSMHLMRAEVPGPEADKLVPKARSTARILYLMYLILTMAEVIFLLFGGMNLYDALIHSFSTAGTGGFSNRNASVSYYDSAYIDGVITVFMILFGINFNIYFAIYIKNWKSALKNEEARTYLGVIAAAILMITVNIYHIYGNVASAFRYSSFSGGSGDHDNGILHCGL